MSEEPEPPRKIYGFKSRDFDRANDIPTPAPPPPTTPDPGVQAVDTGRIDVRALVASAKVVPAGAPAPRPAGPPSEIHAMLAQNTAVAEAAGLHALTPQKVRPSKRRRDYWLVLVGGNGVLLGVFGGVIGFSFFSCLFLLGGMLFFSTATWWVMWHVMDDY